MGRKALSNIFFGILLIIVGVVSVRLMHDATLFVFTFLLGIFALFGED